MTPEFRARVSEAYCLLKGIACKRRYTDEELAEATAYVKREQAENAYSNYKSKREWPAYDEAHFDTATDGRNLASWSKWK